jgi:hypothetical protein
VAKKWLSTVLAKLMWHDAIFKTKYARDGHTVEIEDWSVRIQWRGRRETFNLKTPNKAAAAAKAKEIYTILVGRGWDATLEKFKPGDGAHISFDNRRFSHRVARPLVG